MSILLSEEEESHLCNLLVLQLSDLRLFIGSKEAFKQKLDKYLELIPDQPEVNKRKPGRCTMTGEPSNSIPDWTRILDLDNTEFDLIDDDDNMTIPVDGCDDISITNCVISIMGSGHSPGHSYM